LVDCDGLRIPVSSLSSRDAEEALANPTTKRKREASKDLKRKLHKKSIRNLVTCDIPQHCWVAISRSTTFP